MSTPPYCPPSWNRFHIIRGLLANGNCHEAPNGGPVAMRTFRGAGGALVTTCRPHIDYGAPVACRLGGARGSYMPSTGTSRARQPSSCQSVLGHPRLCDRARGTVDLVVLSGY